MKYENMNFAELLSAAQSGDNDAMAYILEMYMPTINRHSRINGVLNEDIRQEILLHIINNIQKFKI